jgi:hypothetical protein
MLGETHERQKDQEEAVKAYETAADRYHDRPQIAADALFKAGLSYKKQVQSADYDHNLAGQSINSLNDFITLFPNDPRVPEAQKLIGELKTEAARGNFTIAEYYEKNRKLRAALIYYNEAIVQDANSSYAQTARQRINDLKQKLGEPTAEAAPAPAAETPAAEAAPVVEPAAAPASDPATQTPAPVVEIPAPTAEPAPVAASAPAVSASEPAPVTSATESTSDGTKTNKPSWWSNLRHFKWLPSKPKSQPAPITETPATENTDKK